MTPPERLQPDYKLTEVGVIPNSWQQVQIGSVAKVTKLAGFEYTLHFDYSLSGPIVAVRGLNIKNGSLDLREVHTLPLETSKALPRSRLFKGDLVMSYVGTIGRVAIVPEDNRFHLAPNVAKISLQKNVHPAFLCQYLNGETGQASIHEAAASTTQAAMSMGNLRKIVVPLPPIQEQCAIAEALGDSDTQIAALEALTAKKRDLKQAAMQQLLTGKTRLPGFSGKWEVKRLGEIAEVVMGQSPSSANYNRAGLGWPLIQGNADISDRKTIRRVFTSQLTKLGKAGDILMSVRAPVGEIAIAMFDHCLGRGVCAIRYPNDYLYHVLVANEPKWATLSKGSTFDSVNSAEVKSFELYWPSDPNEQSSIAEVLSDMDDEITALEAETQKARAIKQGMMQTLLTGKVRLV